MNNEDSLNQLHKYIYSKYTSKKKNNLYYDKHFVAEGIDYTNYIALKYESINNKDISNLYTIEGWYILWYLMSEAQQKLYIKTSINIIAQDTSIKDKEVKELLLHLEKQKVIKLYAYTSTGKTKAKNVITFTEKIEITIVYNTKEYVNQNGYCIVPIDFIKTVLPTLSPQAWSIYTILLTRYSWFTTLERIDPTTGEIYYSHKLNHYSFPTYEQMSELLGYNSRNTITKYIKELCDNKYNLIYIINNADGKKTKVINGKNIKDNKTYGVYLMERIEYQYYYCYEQNKKIAKDFKKLIDTTEQYILKDHDYVITQYKNIFKEYENAIKQQKDEWYLSNKEQMKINLSL